MPSGLRRYITAVVWSPRSGPLLAVGAVMIGGLASCAGSPRPSERQALAPIEGRECVRARRVWFEDFESGDYSRWSSRTYHHDWGPQSGSCRENGVTSADAHGGSRSHRSAITCQSHTDVHRGYGGIQLEGERVLDTYTNRGRGLEAPHGAVTTFWARLELPYDLGEGRWISLWTADTDCAWGEEVVTLGLDAPERRLTPAHVTDLRFERSAPRFPLGRWVRVTVYVNAHRGELRVWQDGDPVASARFARPSTDLCQWHWGLYASGDNDAVVLYEDDVSLWVLDRDWTERAREPWLERATICE